MALTVLTTVSTFLFQLPSSISKPYIQAYWLSSTWAYYEILTAKFWKSYLSRTNPNYTEYI